MTEEELAEIEGRVATCAPLRTGDMMDLIAEVRRLNRELENWHEAVKFVEKEARTEIRQLHDHIRELEQFRI